MNIFLLTPIQVIVQAAKFGKRPSLPFSVPEVIRKLYLQCVDATRDSRPTAIQAVQEMDTIQKEYEQNPELWESSIVGEKVGDPIPFGSPKLL